MVSPITVDGSLERRNIFVGEAFGPPNVRVVFAGAAEDTKEREDRVFLLIGPSCVREEKATCIDAFANFFYGVQKDDDYRLHIANEKFDKTTPNKAIVTYVFNDSKMPFRPIVVDVKDDDASLLHKWLTENSRLRIDVVCIVFNLLGRIETRHETAIKEMLSILPKRIRSSASVLLTNSDGHPPPVALLRRFDLQESPVYKLNWTTLFTGKPDDSLKELLRANYWNMSEKSLKDMISRMQTLHPHTFNGLPHEPPMFVIHLKPDNASSSSSSSTSTSTFVERRTEHTTTTHHHYDLPPSMDPVQGRAEPSPPLVKTTIFQTTSKHVEDKIVDGPPSGIPKELLKQIEQRSSEDHSHTSGEKKVVVEKTITVKMVKKDDEEDETLIERARAKSMERLALEEKLRREEETRRREEENRRMVEENRRREEENRRREEEKRRREEEERELRKVKDQLEKERKEREAIEKRIREQEQAELTKRAKQEEERLLLIKIEEERREKLRIEQLAYEERTRKEVDDRARKLSEERREMEAERRRLEEERKRLEGRKLEEIKKIEEERLRRAYRFILDEQRRILSHEKSVTEAERKRIEEEIREGERRRKEEEEMRRRREEEEMKRRKEEEELRKRKEEDEFKRRKEEDDAKRKKEDEEWRRKREIERKAREEEEKIRLETQRRREREEEERKRKSMEEKNITITYERTIERTRTEEVDERVLDTRPDTWMTRTYLNGDAPRQVTVIEEGHQSPIGDAPIVRFVFDESTRSYIHHLVEPSRHQQRDPSPARSEQGGLRILSRTETLIDDPFFDDDDGGFLRDSPERVGHHRMSSPTREERYQYVRGPTDLRSPGVAATPADGLSSPEMLRRAETLRRTNQDVQRDSYPSGRESRKRERTQYENLPMDESGNAYIIPDRMRHSKSPIIMKVRMSPKENSPHQSAIAPPLPPVQRVHEIPVQSAATPAAEYSPPPLYQRTPPANASLPQRATPSAVHFASAVGSGAKPVAAGAAPDQYSTINKPLPMPPTPAQRAGKPSPIAPVLTPPPASQSPSHVPPAYIRPPRQLGDDELMSPAGKAPVYGIDRPRELLPPPPPVPIHKHPAQQRAPLARPEDAYGQNRKPAGMSAEEEREYLLRLRPLDEYNRIPGEAERGYRPQDATWSSKPHPIETSTPQNEKRKKEKVVVVKKKEPIFVLFDRHRTRPLQCWDWVLPICCFCIAPIVIILIIVGIILTYALN